MSTTEVAQRSAVMPVVWVKNAAKSFISSLIIHFHQNTIKGLFSQDLQKKGPGTLISIRLYGSEIIWENRKILSTEIIL